MALIKFITHDGSEIEANASAGDSLMVAAVDNGVEGIIAECGGACSCATCHCYIDEAWVDKIPAAEAIEKEMIECALEAKENSRLSCQITITEELDGLVVHIPETQY